MAHYLIQYGQYKGMALSNLPKIVISNICGPFSKKCGQNLFLKNWKLKCRIFFSLGRFVSWDVLSLGTFCPWDILSLGTFCPWDLMSEDVLSWDALSLGMFCLGTFCLYLPTVLTPTGAFAGFNTPNVAGLVGWGPVEGQFEPKFFFVCYEKSNL